jgi:hypothetical protein
MGGILDILCPYALPVDAPSDTYGIDAPPNGMNRPTGKIVSCWEDDPGGGDAYGPPDTPPDGIDPPNTILGS